MRNPGVPGISAGQREFRNSFGAYLAVESQPVRPWTIDLAARFEVYDDFGSTLNGKLATRYNFIETDQHIVAIRAGASTGFRAPSLHQVWFSSISTQFVDEGDGLLVPRTVLTANNQSDVTQAFGIPELSEETSINVSGGLTATLFKNLTLTSDIYYITIDDRIVLTSRFAGAPYSDVLDQFGVAQAQFFANAVDTETFGVDFVADWAFKVGKAKMGFTGSFNYTQTTVQNINIPQGTADIFAGGDLEAIRDIIFNREERNRLEDALPRIKGSLAYRYNYAPFDFFIRGNFWGPVEYTPINEDNDETFDARVTFDVNLGIMTPWGLKLSLGGTNIFNVFPEEHELDANRFNEQFIYSRRVTQFGMNGGFYYARLDYQF